MFNHKIVSALIASAMCVVAIPVIATPYLVSMDNVENLANWATVDNGIGDLYDGAGVKQVDVTYRERAGVGNTAETNDVLFWDSLEYGNNHRALFANQGGTDVLEVEITGLNGHLVNLSQVVVGRWHPDPIDMLDSDWWLYDGNWNELASGNTMMVDFVDYFLNFDVGEFETVRFQFGDDNWDNGIISFNYETDVDGTLDLRLDRVDDPTPSIPGSGPVAEAIPEPTILALFGLGIAGLGFARRYKG